MGKKRRQPAAVPDHIVCAIASEARLHHDTVTRALRGEASARSIALVRLAGLRLGVDLPEPKAEVQS